MEPDYNATYTVNGEKMPYEVKLQLMRLAYELKSADEAIGFYKLMVKAIAADD